MNIKPLADRVLVLYGKYSGTELEHDGAKYLMMRQSDVLAVFTK
jgi:chaperonin GroES